MSLFNWKAKPKAKAEAGNSRGSNAAPDEIDRAAQETEAARPTRSEPYSPDAGAVDSFTVSPEIAMGIVKGFFSPLVKYDHPAWAVTDEEAAPVVPKMQSAIQAVLDRHMPQFMMQMMAKYPEMLSLTYAMALLYYAKFKAVRLVRMEEYRDEQKRLSEARKAESARAVEQPLIYKPDSPGDAPPSITGEFLPREEPPPSI